MRILLYEFITGGGCYALGQPAQQSLGAEGSAMLTALAVDFAALDDVSLDVVLDSDCAAGAELARLPRITLHAVSRAGDDLQQLATLAPRADWTIVIAPEFSGHLLARCELVERVGGRLLGPSAPLVALAGDKHVTAEHLALHGVRAPRGVRIVPGQSLPPDFAYPAVRKPLDGAGSLDVELIDKHDPVREPLEVAGRLEEFCSGIAASVACLCGPVGTLSLIPCRQRLSDDGHFGYQGGSLPIERSLAARAARLALRAVSTLPGARGYLGVDLVLGAAQDGSDDVVMEINPRLTTSYVGLRALARGNLAWAMMEIAAGRAVELCWRGGPIQFDAAGACIDESDLGGS